MVNFANVIIHWYKINFRTLPWRNSKDPYKVWLSEIILQQTQVKQGLPYYKRFVKHYPTVFDLAQASENEILKLWQGLGYYSRARNLHKTAQTVVADYNGQFPDNYKTLKTLKGVGDYTASAIASICFDEPVAVLDGNVFRVFSRIFGIDTPINTTEGRKIFKAKTSKLLYLKDPGTYNQAVMEFGALHCKPKNPNCQTCPFQTDCVAYQQGKIKTLPVKLKKLKIKKRFFNYLVFLIDSDKTLIHKRTGKDIWKNLYEFPLIETSKSISKEELINHSFFEGKPLNRLEISAFYEKPIRHQLTHQRLFIQFWLIKMSRLNLDKIRAGKQLVKTKNLEKFPVSTVIENFLNTFEF